MSKLVLGKPVWGIIHQSGSGQAKDQCWDVVRDGPRRTILCGVILTQSNQVKRIILEEIRDNLLDLTNQKRHDYQIKHFRGI